MSEAETPAGSDRLSADVLAWLMRCYETQELWKRKAADVYMMSNGDSILARTRIAASVRLYFLQGKLAAEEVGRWNEDFREATRVQVHPPRVSPSNAGYVDWLYVADYLLLSCAGTVEEHIEENQRREAEYQQLLSSYELRLTVHTARGLLQEHPGMGDDGILQLLKSTRNDASLANVKEARRSQGGAPYAAPVEPERPDSLHRYVSVYFPTVGHHSREAASSDVVT